MHIPEPLLQAGRKLFRGSLAYARWLHTGFPAGKVEPLPIVDQDLRCAPNLYVAGDLTGVPLLKHALDSGTRAVRTLSTDPKLASQRQRHPERLDLIILGAGVAGLAAAVEARTLGLRFEVIEAARPLATLHDFPPGKPILTVPHAFTPAGAITLQASTREELLLTLHQQTRDVPIRQARALGVHPREDGVEVELEGQPTVFAHKVLIAIGKTGNHRRLDVLGETLDKVFHRLLDPAAHAGQDVLVCGGGDSAVEAALALAEAGARVTLAVRATQLVRPKPERLTALEQGIARGLPIRLLTSTQVTQIMPAQVRLEGPAGVQELPNQAVYALLGREAPLAFFRNSRLPLRGERTVRTWIELFLILCLSFFVYHWKAGGSINEYFKKYSLFPYNINSFVDPVWPGLGASGGEGVASWAYTLARVLARTLEEPGFYYAAAYSLAVLIFGLRRIRRRPSPYVLRQTLSLVMIQLVPLFLLPYFLLPGMGALGAFDSGLLKHLADALFPTVDYGQGREYWRAFGLILAWPLFIWNVFSSQPLWAWLGLSLVQTGILIPYLVRRWGKGAYCGWICSCGALAETLGDTHRHKMPHGPTWNRLNLAGQVLLALSGVLLVLRVASWLAPGGHLESLFWGMLSGWQLGPLPLSWYWWVDVTLAGVLGVGLYFTFSGRVWCRFFCPLAAWMNLVTRLGTRFRIRTDKSRCISCGLCTATCHLGIDVMAFAASGRPLDDPQCVRCSACISACPTDALALATLDPATGALKPDTWSARSFSV